jgi:hypothetical protein
MTMTRTVTSITIASTDDGFTLEYDGLFEFLRDGGDFELALPIDTDDSGIYPETADSLTDTEGEILIARTDGDVEASGLIAAADIIEDDLLVRVDDPEYVSSSDLDVDRADLDVEL